MQNAEQQSERHLSEGWPDGWVGRFNLSFCCSYKTAIKFQLNTNSMEKEKKRKEKEKAAYKAACGSLQKVLYLYHSFRRSKSLYFFFTVPWHSWCGCFSLSLFGVWMKEFDGKINPMFSSWFDWFQFCKTHMM